MCTLPRGDLNKIILRETTKEYVLRDFKEGKLVLVMNSGSVIAQDGREAFWMGTVSFYVQLFDKLSQFQEYIYI